MTNNSPAALLPLITAALIAGLEANVARLAAEYRAAGVRVSAELAREYDAALNHMLNTRNAHGVARFHEDQARMQAARAARFARFA